MSIRADISDIDGSLLNPAATIQNAVARGDTVADIFIDNWYIVLAVSFIPAYFFYREQHEFRRDEYGFAVRTPGENIRKFIACWLIICAFFGLVFGLLFVLEEFDLFY